MSRTSPDSSGVVVIVNPRAGAGRAGRNVDRLKREADAILGDWTLRVTEAPGHASHFAAEAADAGARVVVAAGGDGTIHEVVGGLFDGRQRRGDGTTALGLLPFGTGSDFQKSLDVPADLSAALRLLATAEPRAVNVGYAETTVNGEPDAQPFINVAGFGANGDVVRRANRMSKRLGGTMTFLGASLQTAMAYSPAPMRLRWRHDPDGDEQAWEGTVLSCFVANGGYCGGGMWVGRGGDLVDGRFDVTVLPPDSAVTQVLRARRLYDGSLESWPGARRLQVCELIAEPATHRSAWIDLDGEVGGQLPARFTTLPGALAVVGRWADAQG